MEASTILTIVATAFARSGAGKNRSAYEEKRMRQSLPCARSVGLTRTTSIFSKSTASAGLLRQALKRGA